MTYDITPFRGDHSKPPGPGASRWRRDESERNSRSKRRRGTNEQMRMYWTPFSIIPMYWKQVNCVYMHQHGVSGTAISSTEQWLHGDVVRLAKSSQPVCRPDDAPSNISQTLHVILGIFTSIHPFTTIPCMEWHVNFFETAGCSYRCLKQTTNQITSWIISVYNDLKSVAYL